MDQVKENWDEYDGWQFRQTAKSGKDKTHQNSSEATSSSGPEELASSTISKYDNVMSHKE